MYELAALHQAIGEYGEATRSATRALELAREQKRRPLEAQVCNMLGMIAWGQSRFDETGQIQWYGDRTMWILTDKQAFENALAEPISKVWVVDAATYDLYFAARLDAKVVARSGHLLCVRLS